MNTISFDTVDLRDPLHFFFLLDASASMNSRRIRALNDAMREALAVIPAACEGDPGALKAFASSGDLCITVDDPAELPGAMCSAIRRILTTYFPKPLPPTPPCSATTMDDHEWI